MAEAKPVDRLLPRYYLVHDTPEGQRFAYPVPALEGYPQYHFPDETHVVEWSTPEGVPVAQSGTWLIAGEPVGVVIATWLPSRRPAGYRKRTEAPRSSVALPVWGVALEVPGDELLAHVGSCSGSDECLQCLVFQEVYEREWVQPDREIRSTSFEGWVPLPGELDPDPDREWLLGDQSMTAVYGAYTAHLWPGSLPNFRDAVYARLKADPRVEYVFDAKNHPSSQPRGTLQTTVPIRWETPRTEMVTRTGTRGQKLRGQRPVPRPVAHKVSTTLVVPADLRAGSKAEALDRWDQEVEEWVERFVPVDVVACDRCDGHGHLLRSEVESC